MQDYNLFIFDPAADGRYSVMRLGSLLADPAQKGRALRRQSKRDRYHRRLRLRRLDDLHDKTFFLRALSCAAARRR